MKYRYFTIPRHNNGYEKEFFIVGPIVLQVDYDDVDHAEQDRLARKVAKILNKYWDEE